MLSTAEALTKGYYLDPHGWVFEFGDGYELRFEPLLWENHMYVALYKNGDLLTEKVVVKPGKE